MTMRIREWIEKPVSTDSFRFLPGGSIVMGTLPDGSKRVIAAGAGSRVWDESGREYIDCLVGSGSLILGHAPPEVVEAVTRQVRRGSNFYATTRPALDLAERLVHHVPSAEMVQFCGSGSEATFYAMRLARAVTGKSRVLKFEGAFHGGNDYALMSWIPGQAGDYPEAVPDSIGIPPSMVGEVLVAPFNDLDTTTRIVEEASDSLAAIIVEPLQRVISPAAGFLSGVRELCDRHGIVLIFDEMVTGFRFGLGGAQQHYGVKPDLTCLGKIIGGGYPLAAVTGPSSMMRLASHDRPFPHRAFMSGTLNGNPVAAAAGLKTIDILERPGTYQRLFEIGDRMRSGLEDLFSAAGLEAQVVGEGPLFQPFLTATPVVDHRSALTSDAATVRALAAGVLNLGVFTTGEKGYLTLAHDDDDIQTVLKVWERSLHQLSA